MPRFDMLAVAASISAPLFGAGEDRAFPCDMEVAALELPVSIELIAGLTPRKADEWLFRRAGWRGALSMDGRQVRGCLIAHRSHAFIFMQEEETESSRRFTLAHELAHFLGHYLAARRLAQARLGADVLNVLDGRRPATEAERISGVLQRCPLGVFRDVLDRVGGSPVTLLAHRMEEEADAAAFEVLAPPAAVLALAPRRAVLTADGLIEVMIDRFGLERVDAKRHAHVVLRLHRKLSPCLIDQLRAAPMGVTNG